MRAKIIQTILIPLTIILGIRAMAPPGAPDENNPLLICASCRAIVENTLNQLNGRTSEMDVTDVLERACRESNFGNFNFPPPYMRMGCEKVIRKGYDEIEESIMARNPDTEVEDKLQEKICSEVLDFCDESMNFTLNNPEPASSRPPSGQMGGVNDQGMLEGMDGLDMEKLRQMMKEQGGDIKVAGAGMERPDLDGQDL